MSEITAGTYLLIVSCISVLVYMVALGQLLIGEHRAGLVRTGVCRLVAALLYVGVALVTLQTHTTGPLIGLGVLTVVQLMWQANSVADVLLTRRLRKTQGVYMPEEPGVRPPTPNYIAPLGDAVVAAEIDRLSNELATLKNDRLTPLEYSVAAALGVRRYAWGAIAFTGVLAIIGLVFSLVVFNRADNAAALSQDNARLLTQLQSVQAREDATVHSFCGLYDAFLGFYSPKSKAAFQDGPQAYDALFRALFAQSNNISCNLRIPAGLGS